MRQRLGWRLGLRLCLQPALRGLALAGLVLGVHPSQATTPLATLQAQVDAEVQDGFERPDGALAALAAIEHRPPRAGTAGTGASSSSGASANASASANANANANASARTLLLGRGLIVAGSGRVTQTMTVVNELRALAAQHQDSVAAADAALVQSLLAHTRGQVAQAGQAAQTALQGYQLACPARSDCDYRAQWLAMHLLASQGASSGNPAGTREQALAAADLARTAGDTARQATALLLAADASSKLEDASSAHRDAARAQRLVRLDGSAVLQTRLKIHEAHRMVASGDAEGARLATQQGLALADTARAPRLQAVLLANLSDLDVKTGHPQAALRAVEQALPTARRHGDLRTERVLLHNAALARIALGQADSARRTLDELLAAHTASGAAGDQAVVLREFADAFAAAGELRTALALYHRERTLAARITASNRDAALAALRARFDRESQQRQLEQLGRDGALMTARLANRGVMQRVWLGSACVLLLAAGVVALLYRRMRQLNRQLASNHAHLHAQSQRDPLTGLANRRALHNQARQQRLAQQFDGALLLVDIDHFKHVNDNHGHAVGDLVLVEVAQRLAAAVRATGRPHDLVVRWGGEEFLVCMPGADTATAQALAGALLQAIGDTRVPVQGQGLRVTVSVGFGCFPLAPGLPPLSLERAINLADMALYTAKNQGRNRAVGVVALQHPAGHDAGSALHQVEADFDAAWQAGSISLWRVSGPAPVAPADHPDHGSHTDTNTTAHATDALQAEPA